MQAQTTPQQPQTNQYKLIKKLGEGAFGEIFVGYDLVEKRFVAIKKEALASNRRQLQTQSRMIQSLTPTNGENVALPKIYAYLTDSSYNMMVLELLGPSLEDLFNLCQKRFSLKTTLMVGIQMLQLIQYIHSKEALHRDIKPDNFLIGCKQNSKRVYMIDFGLSRKYITQKREHIPYKGSKTLTGTARYVSINTHIGIQQSRRDDLESFVYVLIYFLKGSLPWQNLKATDKKQKYQRIMQRKLSIPISVLCSGIPQGIEEILVYTRGLQFQDAPDYTIISQKLTQIALDNNIELNDGMYDWIEVAKIKRQKLVERGQLKPYKNESK